jgi:dTDP-4-amino-4,6-dideoxygalactose transaminase
VAPDAGVTRDELMGRLQERKVGSGVHYRGVHLHPYYRDRFGIDPASLPVASDISERTLSLPLDTQLTADDQDYVADALSAVLETSQAGV